MTKNTTNENPHFKEIDAAIAALTPDQRAAIMAFDKVVPARHVPLADARDIAGLLSGIKSVAYVSKGAMDSDTLKKLKLFRTTINQYSEAYAFDKHVLQEFKRVVTYAFGKRREATAEHKVVGTLLGYPKTATNYFIQRIGNIDTYPMVFLWSTHNTLLGEFFQDYILSPKHYSDEIYTYSQPLEYATIHLMPQTYKKMQRLLRKSQRRRKLNVLLGRSEQHSSIPTLFV